MLHFFSRAAAYAVIAALVFIALSDSEVVPLALQGVSVLLLVLIMVVHYAYGQEHDHTNE